MKHDEIFLTRNVYPNYSEDKGSPKVNNLPYLFGQDTVEFEASRKGSLEKFGLPDINNFSDEINPDMGQFYESIFYLRQRTQDLCKGTVSA